MYVPPATLLIIRRITRRNALDPRLEPTDRHMQRWAESQGAGLAVFPDDADTIPRMKLPPLPDCDAVITDQIVLRSPEYWRDFVMSWYRSSTPVQVIAERLGVERQRIYEERRLVLAYLLGRLTEAGVRIASYRFR